MSNENKAAPADEREAFRAAYEAVANGGWDSVKDMGLSMFQAGVAHARAQRAEQGEAVAVIRTVPGTDWKSLDFAPGFSLQEQDELTKLYTNPQPAAVEALVEALASSISQMEMAAACIESGRYDEARLHVTSMMKEKRAALSAYREGGE